MSTELIRITGLYNRNIDVNNLNRYRILFSNIDFFTSKYFIEHFRLKEYFYFDDILNKIEDFNIIDFYNDIDTFARPVSKIVTTDIFKYASKVVGSGNVKLVTNQNMITWFDYFGISEYQKFIFTSKLLKWNIPNELGIDIG